MVAAIVFATAAGPGVTGSLIDLGVPLSTQMQWAGLYCLVAMLFLGAAAITIHRRYIGEQEGAESSSTANDPV